MKGKLGSVDDAAFLALFLVVLAIIAYPLIEVALTFSDVINDDPAIASDVKTTGTSYLNRWPAIMDGIYVLLLLGGYLATFILAFYLDSQPAFFIAAAVFFTALSFVIPMLANSFETVTSGHFALAEANLTMIPLIMQYYLQITIIAWFMIAFALYAKRVAS